MSAAESEPAARPAAVRRTYGRPREPLEDVPADRPVEPVPAYDDFALGIDAPVSRPSYAKSAAAKARVVGSDSDMASDKEDDGKRVSLPGGMYNWKSRLAALDASDSEDEAKAVRKKVPATKRATPGSPTPSMRNTTRAAPKPSTRPTIADQDSSPLSSHREGVSFDFSTELNKSGDQSPDTSPSTSPVELLPVIEEAALKSKSKPKPKSKAKGSELDEPKSDAAKSKGKKVKATADKVAKPKRLTKKEKAEMERETARIISNQRVSLSRADVDKRLPLSQWTQKMSSTFQSRSQSATPAPQVPKPAPSSPIDRFSSSSAVDDLRAAAKPAFTRDPKQPVMNTKDMNKVLLARSKAQGVKIREEKKQDWIRRGGSLKVPEEQKAPVEAPKADADADEDARDLDYAPDEESGDESGREDSPGVGSGDEATDATGVERPPVSSVAAQSDYEMAGDTEDEEQERAPKRKAQGKRRKAALVLDESDSERDDVRVHVLVPASSLLGFPGGLVPQRRPMSPVGSASESEKDKENSEFRAFDVSEDKENRAAPRYVHETQSSVSPAPRLSPALAFSDEEDKENEPEPVLAQPPFANRLQRRATYDSSQSRSVLGDIATEERPALATLSLESPVQHGNGDDSPTQQRRSPGLGVGGPGLTQLFEQPEPSQRPARLPRSVSEQIPRRLFDATQESVQFTPTQHRRVGALISDSQRQRDDQILAMDMEEEPTQVASAAPPKEEWFVKDNGLMTQTRPDFTPIHPLKAPFGALEASPFTPTLDSATAPKLTRLKRKSSPGSPSLKTQSVDGDEDSLETEFFGSSDPPAKRHKTNAFEVLKGGAALSDKLKAKEEKRKMQNEYVQDQADESDDETGLGFGGVSSFQDEEIDEAAIAEEVKDMVDDAQMDVDELAPDLVAEKHQEHLKQDDEEIQQLHQKVVQGELRKKRRGDGLTMSDDDSDDEGRIRRPRPVKHARNIENDSLPELAKHPETRAFFNTYQNATVDDDKFECREMDFANADDDEELEVEGAGDEEEKEEEKAPRRRFVDPRQLRDELLAQYKQPEPTINPDDVDWIDDDEDEMDLEIQEVPVKGAREAAAERVDRDLVPKHRSSATSAKLQTWAKLEGANKGFNARRGGAGTAVTGHASSSRAAQSSASADQRKAKPAIKPRKSSLGKFLEKTKSRQG